MPNRKSAPLKNTRHEAFAQAIAKGESASAAYEKAGYKPNRRAASRLWTNVDVKNRVEALQERVAEKAEWTAADRLKMLGDIAVKASKSEMRTAIAAIAEANKMQGSHAPQKQEHDVSDRFKDMMQQVMSGATTAPISTGDE